MLELFAMSTHYWSRVSSGLIGVSSCRYLEEVLSNYQNEAIIKKNMASFYTGEILSTVDKLS